MLAEAAQIILIGIATLLCIGCIIAALLYVCKIPHPLIGCKQSTFPQSELGRIASSR